MGQRQILEQEMLLNVHHLGNYKGFRSSVLGTRDKDQYIYFLLSHSIYISPMGEMGSKQKGQEVCVCVCMCTCVWVCVWVCV